MSYFTSAFLQFFQELRNNNDRDWYHTNKKRFETAVKIPFEAFIADCIDLLSAQDNRIMITPKEAIFRIYRDTRFSKDKTPYKTHMSAIISPGGRKDMTSPGIYLECSDQHFRIYSGVYMPDAKQLQRIREAIASEPDHFASLLKDKTFKKHFGDIQGEKNKRIKKEFLELAEKQPLLYNKQFYYFAEFPAETLLDKKLTKIVEKHFLASRPLSEFFAAALGTE